MNIGNVRHINQERTTVKAQKDKKVLSFCYITHFRKTVLIEFVNSEKLYFSQKKWIEKRLSIIKKQDNVNNYLDENDLPLKLNEVKNVFCGSTRIRELYIHTIIPIEAKKTNLYTLNLNMEEGIFTRQTQANSTEEAYSNFLKDKNEFDDSLENPEIYHFLLENFDNYQAIIQNHSYIKIASMNEKKEFVKPRKRRKNEWRFSQKNCTIFIFPTFEGEVK
jgi:hypothetical protein